MLQESAGLRVALNQEPWEDVYVVRCPDSVAGGEPWDGTNLTSMAGVESVIGKMRQGDISRGPRQPEVDPCEARCPATQAQRLSR